MDNPLLNQSGCVNFAEVQPQHIIPAMEKVLLNSNSTIEKIIAHAEHTYETLLGELDRIQANIDRMWSPPVILNFVANSKEIREAYNHARHSLTEFYTKLKSNSALYKQVVSFGEDKRNELNTEQQAVLDIYLRDFRLNGASLEDDKKYRYQELVLELSDLEAKFAENVLDSTVSYKYLITDENELSGIPSSIKKALKREAKENNEEGFLCTLQMPIVNAILRYADNRELRKKIYVAYNSCALEEERDNRPLIHKILNLRQELAQLLGFATFAHLSLASKTAESPEQVIDFLNSLEEKTREQSQKEYDELLTFYKKTENDILRAWDYSYYLEKLRQNTFSFTEEDLCPYFSIDSVLSGLFEIVEKIYDARVIEVENKNVWHPEIRYFRLLDGEDTIGDFFLDFHPRSSKRSGAWMQDVVGRVKVENGFEIPVGLIGGNATRETEDTPALLMHREVVTLFHEFGHMSQFLFTKCSEYSVSGINGVPWDVVELPSQFLENWAWEKEALKIFAHHYETKEAIPDELCDKLISARNFHQATQIRRQLEFGLLDMHLHYDYNSEETSLFNFSEKIHNKLSHFPLLPDTLFLASFKHIFAGGYSAGYFSYKWAEVWEADAFDYFKEKGIFDTATGTSFRKNILEKGGSENPFALYEKFRGRRPQPDALLKKYDIL